MNMMEIERKILGINKADILARIKRLNPAPQKLFEGLVCVKYFDFPDRRIRKKHDLLRVREFIEKGKKPYVEFAYKTYKGVKKGCKHLEEMETRISGNAAFKTTCDFLLGIGLKQTAYYEKKRTICKWGKVKFELDEYPKIPAFLEIEGHSTEAIEKTIKALGLQDHEQTAESISALMRRKYPKISLNGLRF